MALFALGRSRHGAGAGCTWNDIVDRKVDARVERTRGRPLPSGELKLRDALVWMVLQSLVGVAILFKFNKFAGGVALASLILVAIYPTMKRLTSWPQVVLGLRLQIGGALVGYAGGDRHAVVGKRSRLYLGGVAWTMVYDTNLRHAGPARRCRDRRPASNRPALSPRAPRRWLTLFGRIGGLRPGRWPAISPPSVPTIFAILLLIALHFVWQIAFLKPHDQADCLMKFKANGWLGLLLVAAIIAGHLA